MFVYAQLLIVPLGGGFGEGVGMAVAGKEQHMMVLVILFHRHNCPQRRGPPGDQLQVTQPYQANAIRYCSREPCQ